MITKHTATDPQIRALTTAEIARQISIHADRRQQIVNERASLFAHALKNGGAGDSPPIDDDEKAARAHAKHLLNGDAPDSLELSESNITLDKKLYREMRGIDIVLKILGDKNLVALTVEAIKWEEVHRDEWRTLVREITFAAIRTDALDRRARTLLASCGDLSAVRLPMTIIANSRYTADIPLNELKDAALSAGVLTAAEIRKAENV